MKRRDIIKFIPAISLLTVSPSISFGAFGAFGGKKNIPFNHDYDLNAFAGINIFNNDFDQFILTDSQWLQIKAYITHALSLPTTAEEFKYEFSIPEDTDVQGFSWLMSCYSELKSSAELWNSSLFEDMVQSIRNMADFCDTQAVLMSWIYILIECLKSDSDAGQSISFENNKQILLTILDQMTKYTSARPEEFETIRERMTEFQNLLSKNSVELDTLEVQYSELLTNFDGDAIKNEITRLRKEVDDLNTEYARLVTIAATTPTYAWVPFWGWFIAPAIAGVYGAQAAEVNRLREEKLTELRTLETSLNHGDKIYRSWGLAKQSISTTDGLIEPATHSLGLLIGEWRIVEISLSNFIKTIRQLDSDLDEDSIIAAILAEFSAQELEQNWTKLGDKCRQFIQSVTIETIH